MPKFNRKPKQIEARQFTGGEKSAKDLISWIEKHNRKAVWWEGRVAEMKDGKAAMPEEFHVETPRGLMIGKPGDWIVRTPEGEFYPSKPENFNAKYEMA